MSHETHNTHVQCGDIYRAAERRARGQMHRDLAAWRGPAPVIKMYYQ